MAVHSGFPILSTRDLPALVSFYERAFGAIVAYRFSQGDADVYVSLDLGGARLGLGWDPETPDAAGVARAALWFYVDDVDAVFDAAVRSGASVAQPPMLMPWGERVARVIDPEGTPINLGAEA